MVLVLVAIDTAGVRYENKNKTYLLHICIAQGSHSGGQHVVGMHAWLV